MTGIWLHYLSGVFQVHAQACEEGCQHAVILQQLVPQSSLHINHANQIRGSPHRLWHFCMQHKPATVLAMTFDAGKNRQMNCDGVRPARHLHPDAPGTHHPLHWLDACQPWPTSCGTTPRQPQMVWGHHSLQGRADASISQANRLLSAAQSEGRQTTADDMLALTAKLQA